MRSSPDFLITSRWQLSPKQKKLNGPDPFTAERPPNDIVADASEYSALQCVENIYLVSAAEASVLGASIIP